MWLGCGIIRINRWLRLAAKILDQAGSPASQEKDKVLAALAPRGGEVRRRCGKGEGVVYGGVRNLPRTSEYSETRWGRFWTGWVPTSVADLLVAVVDGHEWGSGPEFSGVQYRQGGDGETLVGVIAQENTTSLQLRSPAGVVDVAIDQIATRGEYPALYGSKI